MACLDSFLVRSSPFTFFALLFNNVSGFSVNFVHMLLVENYVKMNLYTALDCHRVSYFSIVIYAGTQSVCMCFLVLFSLSHLSGLNRKYWFWWRFIAGIPFIRNSIRHSSDLSNKLQLGDWCYLGKPSYLLPLDAKLS